jgi:tetratricopeptide (TPR) repeat protein
VLGHRAHELDPLAHRSDVATTLLRAGRYEEALDIATKAIEFDPLYDRGRATYGWALFLNGRPAEGIEQLERAVQLSNGHSTWVSQLGQAYAMTGRQDDARRLLQQLRDDSTTRYIPPYHLAYVLVGLGEHEQALDLLEQALEERSGNVSAIRGSFLFAPLRSHPRFLALLKKMNLA